MQVQMENEIKAILRYEGALDTLPTSADSSSSSNNHVTLNCFDIGAPSLKPGSTCLPVTALHTHSHYHDKYGNLAIANPEETHEVAFEHSRGSKYCGHFTRVRPNEYEK